MRACNVLHLRDTFEIGGPGKTILETHRHLDADRFRLHLGVFHRLGESEETPFVSAARREGLPVHLVRGRSQFDPRLITRVAGLIRDHKIDIVHTHEVKSDLIGCLAARLRGVPVMTTLHGWIGNGPKQRCYIALDKRLVRRFDRVIAVSEQIARELAQAGVTGSRVRVLHNAIVLENYRRTGERGQLQELLGRELPGPVVACVGRLSPEKGQAELIEALGMLAKDGRVVSAVLLGDGPTRASLLRRVQELGLESRVLLPGHVVRPERYLEAVDLVVLPSHSEGLPNAAIEALAMEIPVLATAVGGTPEIIVDRETGRLVPPRSAGALAAGILEFLADPEGWRRMAIRGRRLIERSFDFQARTRKLEDIYAELAGGMGAG